MKAGSLVIRAPEHVNSKVWVATCAANGKLPTTIFKVESVEGAFIRLEGFKRKVFVARLFMPAICPKAKQRKRNPQLITKAAKLVGGVMRVDGVFEDKARICQIDIVRDDVIFKPLNPSLTAQVLPISYVHRNLGNNICVMCIERF